MESSEILKTFKIQLIKTVIKIKWKWSRKRAWKLNYWHIQFNKKCLGRIRRGTWEIKIRSNWKIKVSPWSFGQTSSKNNDLEKYAKKKAYSCFNSWVDFCHYKIERWRSFFKNYWGFDE